MENLKKQNSVIRILGYLVPYWYYILMSTIGGVIKLTAPLIVPQFFKYFTDDLLTAKNQLPTAEKLLIIYKILALLLCLFIFIYIPATYFREVGALRLSSKVMHKMRCQLYDHLLPMSARFHEANKSGELVSRINNDVEQVHGFIWNVATNIWVDSIVLTIYLVLLFPISVPLTLLACVMLPFSVFITKKVRFHIKESGRKRQAELSRLSGYFQERMAGFAVIRLFHKEQEESQKFYKLSSEIWRHTKRQDTFSSVGASISSTLYMLIQIIILCLSASFVVKGKMTIGSLIVFYSYAGMMMTPLQRFAELNVVYAKSMAGIERVFEMLDMPVDINEAQQPLTLQPLAALNLEFDHVGFSYKKDSGEKTLEDINFTIHDGEKVALVGSSGCGKTTLVNLISRFYDPDEGEILLSGHRIEDYSLDSLYKQVGMVFQDTILFSESIADNLKYGKENVTMKEMEEAAKAANAYDFIMKTPNQWDTMLGERGIGLSGGQKQRLSIARIFVKNPRLLILDEATSALDSESEALVQNALDRLMAGRTSIVIAHRLSTILNSDKIIVMDKGKIVESGTHEHLLAKNGRYSELYYNQFKEVLDLAE